MSARWLDLVDPTRAEVDAVLPVGVDPDVIEQLADPVNALREAQPLLEDHGSYIFGVLVPVLTDNDEQTPQEIYFVATPDRLITVRKSTPNGASFDVGALHAADESGSSVGVLIHRLVDQVADSYLDLLDVIYGEIDDLEDQIDDLRPAGVRLRLAELRHGLMRRRRTVSATRVAAHRIADGRVEVGDHALFPPEVERLFADTYDTLVRVTEELDIARDLLSGVRDHMQSKIAENQNEVGKKLTVIASLVLVPSLIVGYYGQNFEPAFDEPFWNLGVSTGLILGTTMVQLALYRWRRWI